MKSIIFSGITFMTGVASGSLAYACKSDPGLSLIVCFLVSVIGAGFALAAGEQP